MKRTRWAGLLLLAAPLLSGCAGFWQNPSSSSSSTGTSTLSSGVFFVLNQTDAEIVPYYISAGTLESSYGPYTLSETPYSMAVSPNGLFLYVAMGDIVYGYEIGSEGKLTSLGTVFDDGAGYAHALAVDSTGGWLLIGSLDLLYALPINTTSSGSSDYGLATGSALYVTMPGQVTQIAVAEDDAYVFAACGAAGSAAIPFTYSNSDPLGTVVDIAPAYSGGTAYSVAADPQNRVFYIGETLAYSGSSGGVRLFNYSTLKSSGSASSAELSTYSSGGLAPYAILAEASSDGDYVYVANHTVSGSSYGDIVSFELTSSSGYALTKLASISTGYYTTSLAEDSDNNYLLTTNFGLGTTAGGNPDLAGYNFDSTTTGELDYVIESATGTDPAGAVQVVAVP